MLKRTGGHGGRMEEKKKKDKWNIWECNSW